MTFYFSFLLCSSYSLSFFFTDPATTEIYTLSLHDALPIFGVPAQNIHVYDRYAYEIEIGSYQTLVPMGVRVIGLEERKLDRSEEHTSELQSRRDLVCRLLLEKKKKKQK